MMLRTLFRPENLNNYKYFGKMFMNDDEAKTSIISIRYASRCLTERTEENNNKQLAGT
jgi:hypothetical protein